jgi:transcriptional regulator with XRE-family HTH domain
MAALIGPRRTKVATAMRRARQFVGVDRIEFAALLATRLYTEGLTDTDVAVSGETVRAWEDGSAVPSAVILLAAAEVADVELELLFCRRPVLVRLQELEEQVWRQSASLRRLRPSVG